MAQIFVGSSEGEEAQIQAYRNGDGGIVMLTDEDYFDERDRKIHGTSACVVLEAKAAAEFARHILALLEEA